MFVRCSNSSSDILTAAHQNTQTVIDAIQKETAIDQQQHSCETLICQHHQTILRLLSRSTRWQICELYCLTIYMTCDHARKVCGVYSVSQVFNQQFTRPGEELEEEVAEGKVTFVDALTSL